jgi:hypothetical protein
MANREHATFKRSPLRRRLETGMQLGALTFFVVLGVAIYQNVSKGTPRSAGPFTPGPTAVMPREAESPVVSPNEPRIATTPAAKTTPSEESPGTVASSEAAPGNAPTTSAKPGEERSSAAAAIKPEPKTSLLSPASLDCATGSPSSWEFANVRFIDSTSGRTSSLVTSCRISSDNIDPVGCQSAVIVGVGVASAKGINATESARALRRGINLVSALKKDLQTRCTADVAVSAYVLNLGRFSDGQQRDEADQRKVIALVATGAEDGDKAAKDAVATYTKNDPKITHYPICELYKLDSAGQPTLVPTPHDICGDQTGSTVSQR